MQNIIYPEWKELPNFINNEKCFSEGATPKLSDALDNCRNFWRTYYTELGGTELVNLVEKNRFIYPKEGEDDKTKNSPPPWESFSSAVSTRRIGH